MGNACSVGLGKTIQLGMAAQLMALFGSKPILIVVPKTLVEQWQSELLGLLGVPTAIWVGKYWKDELGIEYPAYDSGIAKCPRRIGIISQGLITCGTQSTKETARILIDGDYECVIVDEAHRARRRNLGNEREGEKPDPNNLMKFLMEISPRTKSMILASATPVQLYPLEAWDLLNVLGQGSDHVLGNSLSMWRKDPKFALDIAMGIESWTPTDTNEIENWNLLRNPMPQGDEDVGFASLRRALGMQSNDAVAEGSAFERLKHSDRKKMKWLGRDIASKVSSRQCCMTIACVFVTLPLTPQLFQHSTEAIFEDLREPLAC